MSWVKDKVFADADSFIKWLDAEFGDYIDKHITQNHVHHTWSPSHKHYPKYSTLQLHKNMRSFHVTANGWSDIAQNITIGKDGDIVTGRDIQIAPVSATGHNGNKELHPFAYEMIGNFDSGNDILEGNQLESAIKISRYFYKKGKAIKFHRELLLPNGKVPKTCPGTGIEKDWFMDLVRDSKFDVGNEVEETKPVENPITKPVVGTPIVNKPQPTNPKLPVLRKGDKGEAVKQMQTLLNKFGYKLVVDGIFGNDSDAAVRDFQKKNKLTVDGVCGEMTFGKLKSATPILVSTVSTQTKPKYPNKLYKVQSPMLHDENVKFIQQQLNKAAGKTVVKVDGWYGNDTAKAVGDFQRKYGLVADQFVGAKTWDKLVSIQINLI